jgi:hypothetical protein
MMMDTPIGGPRDDGDDLDQKPPSVVKEET